MSHTPGPWVVHANVKYISVLADNAANPVVCELNPYGRELSAIAANASLIAAAPDLLDVVATLLTARETMDGRLMVDENSPLIDAAREAIKKATSQP